MILAIYFAVTTLLATFMTVTVLRDAFFTYVRLIGRLTDYLPGLFRSPSTLSSIPFLVCSVITRDASLKRLPTNMVRFLSIIL